MIYKNPYVEIYKKDKVYEEFVSLNEELEKLTDEIKYLISYIAGDVIQKIARNIIKGRRIFYHTDLKNAQDYGFGEDGFGKKPRWATYLDYRWRVIYETKYEIIHNSGKIRKGIKKSKLYIFDAIIDAISKIPDFSSKVITGTEPFIHNDNCYLPDDSYYTNGLIISYFGNSYYYSSQIKLISDENETDIYPYDIEDLFRYRHFYPLLNKSLKIHIKKLKKIRNQLRGYIHTKEFKKVVDIYNNIRMLEEL